MKPVEIDNNLTIDLEDFIIIYEEEYRGFEITGFYPKFDKETIVYGVSHEDAYDMELFDTLDEAREFIYKFNWR